MIKPRIIVCNLKGRLYFIRYKEKIIEQNKKFNILRFNFRLLIEEISLKIKIILTSWTLNANFYR
jgi:hypothetical protein